MRLLPSACAFVCAWHALCQERACGPPPHTHTRPATPVRATRTGTSCIVALSRTLGLPSVRTCTRAANIACAMLLHVFGSIIIKQTEGLADVPTFTIDDDNLTDEQLEGLVRPTCVQYLGPLTFFPGPGPRPSSQGLGCVGPTLSHCASTRAPRALAVAVRGTPDERMGRRQRHDGGRKRPGGLWVVPLRHGTGGPRGLARRSATCRLPWMLPERRRRSARETR